METYLIGIGLSLVPIVSYIKFITITSSERFERIVNDGGFYSIEPWSFILITRN